MSSHSRELFFLILQFLDEEKFKETVHKLEQESGFFFNMKHFEDEVHNGNWDEVEKYLSGFTKVDDNRYSMKIFFEIRKQKYLEALDKHDRPKAVDILVKDLKVFSTFNEKLFKEITQLLTLENFRENEQLSKYGDTKSGRAIMLVELKKLIEANPLFRDKLQFPTLRNSRLRTLINQSLNWQHQLCKNPRPNTDMKTLFVDHSCGPPNGALLGGLPKAEGFPPLGAHGPFQPSPSSVLHPAVSAGAIGLGGPSMSDTTFTMEKISKSFWCLHGSDEKPNGYEIPESFTCDECGEWQEDNLCSYCIICSKEWHFGCVPSSPDDINHPYHPYHPLKLLFDGPSAYSNGKCNICQFKLERFFYHCSICDYNMHVRCSTNPPPLLMDAPKCHEHTLTRMARNDRFTCNACGTHGEQCPYVCVPCSLMFHQECINLPHVININRHEDRISLTYSLAFGDRKCPICHKMIDWRYGAYSCAKCPNYVVHSKCATRKDVWDGVELEGVPEEFFDVSPFKVIENGVINHFSHEEHNLKIVVDGIERDKSVRCEACVHPIFFEKHYSCMECSFTLHETCANLPLRKRHGLCVTPLTLTKNEDLFGCRACHMASNGFMYKSGNIELDVRCATTSYYCEYECHPHAIFLTTTDKGITCWECKKNNAYVLNCVECEYSLCFGCATLPKKIKHRSDDHFLLLRFGEKAEGKYWCEVCETVLDPEEWFYTCDDCVVVCHIECVFGGFVNLKPEIKETDGHTREFISNDGMTRPKCVFCESRCPLPLVYNPWSDLENVFCSFNCHGVTFYDSDDSDWN